MSRIFGALFLLAVIGSHSWGQSQNVPMVERGQEIALAVTLSPPPLKQGWIRFYLGPVQGVGFDECQYSADARLGEVRPALQSEWFAVGPETPNLALSVKLPASDPPYTKMQCRWKVYSCALLRTSSSCYLRVRGASKFEVMPASGRPGGPRGLRIRLDTASGCDCNLAGR